MAIKHPIPINYNLDSQQSVQSVCAVIHIDDDNTEVLDLSLMQGGEHIKIPSNSTVTARFVRVKDKILISDNASCAVQENGNIHIPIDNAAAHMLVGEIKIEVNIVDENEILTMQFPLVIKVNNTILADAEISPESEGTIPELLEEAKEAAESATQAAEAATEAISTKQDKLTAGENITISDDNVISAEGGVTDYDELTSRPQINGVTLSGNKTDDDLGIQSKIDDLHKLSSDLVDDTDQTNKFVTDTDKTNWNNKLSSANGAVKSSNIDNGAVTLQKLESGVIDSTLSAQGAAAEAKTTGNYINVLTERETALDGIVSQEWEIGMRYLVNGVETWSGTSTSRMSTKPGTYIRFNKDDLIVMKKTMDYQFLVVYSTDNGSTWTSTPNRDRLYSILEDSIGWVCIKKTSGTFTEEEMQSVINNYFFILRKGTGETKKNALLAEALSIASGSFDRSEIIDSKYGFTYQDAKTTNTVVVSYDLLLPEFEASKGDIFAIKVSISIDYPDMYSNIGVRIYERYNGNTVKATDITDISDTIIYTVSNSYADAIHIRGLLLADEGDITTRHYEIFDYKISVVKKLPGEIEELLTEAGDIWEV